MLVSSETFSSINNTDIINRLIMLATFIRNAIAEYVNFSIVLIDLLTRYD